MTTPSPTVGLAKLREPIPGHLISKLPKPTKAQNDCPREQKATCHVCGGWHHPSVKHLDYVGHAAATHVLLDADPKWTWEPACWGPDGLPRFDQSGGLWIKLTVCGVTRLGYGHASSKPNMDPGAREKEVIGDALRNAAMRFGVALELWSKSDIHQARNGDAWYLAAMDGFQTAKNMGELRERYAAAIKQAQDRGDEEAETDFTVAFTNKAATANRPPGKSPSASTITPKPPPPEPMLDDDEVPF